MNFCSLAFDLDDTLLDTTHTLIPLAAQNACQAMVDLGLKISLEEALAIRQKLATSMSHTDIFALLARDHGNSNKGAMVHAAIEAFYNPPVPDKLDLLPGALENLRSLQKKYSLYLVTMGTQKAQTLKIEALGIRALFKKCYILNGFIGERKEQAFRDILQTEKHTPEKLLSIGNRLSSEIRDAKTLGATTCYFEFGEHVGEKPEQPEDVPDFTIRSHQDLIKTCGL